MARKDWHGHEIEKPEGLFFQDAQQQVDQAAAVERMLLREAIDDIRAQLEQDKEAVLVAVSGAGYTFAFFAG